MEEEDEIRKEFHNYIGRNIQSEIAKASIEILNKNLIPGINNPKIGNENEQAATQRTADIPVEKIETLDDYPKEVEEFRVRHMNFT